MTDLEKITAERDDLAFRLDAERENIRMVEIREQAAIAERDAEREARKALQAALKTAWLSEHAPESAHNALDAALAIAAKLP